MADAAIIVVSGKAGIEAGTKKAWEMCEKYKLPRMVFVTDMDIDEASSRIEGIQCGFRPTSCPDQLAQALKEYKANVK